MTLQGYLIPKRCHFVQNLQYCNSSQIGIISVGEDGHKAPQETLPTRYFSGTKNAHGKILDQGEERVFFFSAQNLQGSHPHHKGFVCLAVTNTNNSQQFGQANLLIRLP